MITPAELAIVLGIIGILHGPGTQAILKWWANRKTKP